MGTRPDACFNEAAGIHRRKRRGRQRIPPPPDAGFNEAAGIHRRKPSSVGGDCGTGITGFNEAAGIHRRKHEKAAAANIAKIASFNEAAGIHRRKLLGVPRHVRTRHVASMRPPEFTGGNLVAAIPAPIVLMVASMRPPEFTGGNTRRPCATRPCRAGRFNEAAGIHRRKPAPGSGCASCLQTASFNEAAGIHRRKRTRSNLRRVGELLA